jgi:hypothetical protein
MAPAWIAPSGQEKGEYQTILSLSISGHLPRSLALPGYSISKKSKEARRLLTCLTNLVGKILVDVALAVALLAQILILTVAVLVDGSSPGSEDQAKRVLVAV